MSVLSQDSARQFLSASTPEEKYAVSDWSICAYICSDELMCDTCMTVLLERHSVDTARQRNGPDEGACHPNPLFQSEAGGCPP